MTRKNRSTTRLAAVPALLPALAAAYLMTAVPEAAAQQNAKRPLDHDAYDTWSRIEGERLSRDGRWALYSLTRENADGELVVRGVAPAVHEVAYTVPRGVSARFDAGATHVVFLIKPELDSLRAARRNERRPGEMPRDSLGILSLATGEVERVARVSSFRLPERAGQWVAYHIDKPSSEPEPEGPEPEPGVPVGESDGSGGVRAVARSAVSALRAAIAEPRPLATRDDEEPAGSPLVIRQLESGDESRFDHVTDYLPAPTGARLAFAAAGEDGEADGVFLVEIGSEPGSGDRAALPLLAGSGAYQRLAFDRTGERLAFLSSPDRTAADTAEFALYYWRERWDSARPMAASGTDGVPAGWVVSRHGEVSFSDAGGRILFHTAPRPEPLAEDAPGNLPDAERVDVEVWHWRDAELHTVQVRRAEDERNRSYLAVLEPSDGRVVQLASPRIPEVVVAGGGDGDVALGTSGLPYRQLVSWDWPSYRDAYLIDVRSGEARRVLEGTQGQPQLSPTGAYVSWYEPRDSAWYALDTRTASSVNLSAPIPHPVHNEVYDQPSPAFPYGAAGWVRGDGEFILYDGHDLWATDPTGQRAPRNVTRGAGREHDLRFRYVRLDQEADDIDPAEALLLSVFDIETRASGFYQGRVAGGTPRQLVFMDRRFSTPVQADDADALIFTREDVAEFPDLWASDPSFSQARRVSEANPQQGEYRWATAELVHWRSADGVPLAGILYKPDDFDPSRRYPLMVNFYDRSSDRLHNHWAQVPHRSVINPVFYASRGYVVFIPDVAYRIGYPGQSAVDAVVPGVLHLIGQGFIDEARIGVQGHSWGGYQIAFMLTRTNLFAAAEAGAPVANMVSAYGQIRWETGLSRMFQYERTQSRLGGSLWEQPVRFVENSPIFWADKIETPLLIMHNDEDGHVPWEQGIELFVALRRLGSPVWLINYNNEPHWPLTFPKRRDWQIRMQQFFDHFLMDSPPPVWLAEGLPALDRGRTLGLELMGEPAHADGEDHETAPGGDY